MTEPETKPAMPDPTDDSVEIVLAKVYAIARLRVRKRRRQLKENPVDTSSQ